MVHTRLLSFTSLFLILSSPGAALPLLSVLLSWRLTVLLPELYTEDILEQQYQLPPVQQMPLDEEDEEEEEEERLRMTHQPVVNPTQEEMSFSTFKPTPTKQATPTGYLLY